MDNQIPDFSFRTIIRLSPDTGKDGSSVPRTLIIGYGNPDREDDGVAWHILGLVAQRLGHTLAIPPDDEFQTFGIEIDLYFTLQVTPELAEMITAYDRVIFVDAHTGIVPEEIHWQDLVGDYQTSPFTHHMTASTCVGLARTLYDARVEAYLVSVRGYAFGFTRILSERTMELAEEAAEQICARIR